jgi:hypothetical protein
MREARAGFLLVALVAASTTTLCSGLAFAQQLRAVQRRDLWRELLTPVHEILLVGDRKQKETPPKRG